MIFIYVAPVSSLFLYFFKILIFWVVTAAGRGGDEGGKGQKIIHNDKKFCLSPSIFQEPYIIRSLFVVQQYKMIFSRIFFIF